MMSANKHTVSVILCNHNYGRFLDDAICSILNQSHDDLELIIVDDGSTDDSRQVIARYDDKRIVCVFKENGGQASAFNAGFEKAGGEFVAFIDSDDTWERDKLATCVAVMKDQGVSIVQHNLMVIDASSRKTGRTHPGIPSGRKNVLRAYCQENDTDFFSVTSGILCRRRDLEKLFPLSLSWRICADVAFSRPLGLMGDVWTVPELLGCYRIHGENNWMNTASQQRVKENMSREFVYVNHWLEKSGFDRRLDFEKSKYYRARIVQTLSWLHPVHVGHLLKGLVAGLKRLGKGGVA